MKTLIIQRLSLILIFPVSFAMSQIPNITVNEFLTSNAHINYDPDYKNYSDWFELYNNENYPINLNGYYLTDDLTIPAKWEITNDIIIEANGYLVFWADNEDDGIHTNFRLNIDGEQIGVYTPDGSIVDTITYGTQQTDISYGRNPNNENEWLYYYNPTPGYINSTIGNTDLISNSPPIFSVSSGFYSTDISLEITVDQKAEIRYTLDSSEPDENSEKYTVPINISDRTDDPNYFSEIPTNITQATWVPPWSPPIGNVRKATIVRAKSYSDDKLPSNIVTHSFFIGAELKDAYSKIPVISLVSDKKHLFSDSAGIYVPGIFITDNYLKGNYYKEWKRPAHFDYFDENSDLIISQELDIKTQGRVSPGNPQKGLHIIARNKYGINSIDYPLFKDCKSKANKLTSFKRFMLRAWGNPAWNHGMVNDALAQTSYAKSSLDIQDYHPTIVFINGEYWGLQEIREANKNPYYYQEHYGIDKDNPGIDLLVGGPKGYTIDEGDDIHWKDMLDFLYNSDMSIDQNYKYIQSQVDIDNFIDYLGISIYFGKWDWPAANEAFWRPRTTDGRWKWVVYDMDLTFHPGEYDMFDRVYSGSQYLPPHFLLIELTKNRHFKVKFINWFLDRINSDFKPEILNKNFDEILHGIYPYLDEHQNRWAIVHNNFHVSTNNTRATIIRKSQLIQSKLQSHFNLGELNTFMLGGINIDGIVKINSLLIDENTPGYNENKKEWIGKYFEDVPITLAAIPNEGFVFDHWEGAIDSLSDSIQFYLDKNMWIGAVFSPMEKIDSLYINEISAYNNSIIADSSGKFEDWVEIYNTSSDTINLSGLYLTDDFTQPTKWKIPTVDSTSFSILPDEHKIIWCDNEPQEGQDHVGFSLNKMGEQIGLIQITGNNTVFIDSLSFPEQLPNISYGRFPDASNNWEVMLVPTPGSSNVFKPISENQLNAPQLFQNYPNPFSLNTSISFYLSEVNDISLDIYSITGNLVRTLSKKQQGIGYGELLWDGKDIYGNSVSSGVYFYRIQIDNFIKVKKMLFLK